MASALHFFWFWRGQLGEGRAWIEQLLDLHERLGEAAHPDHSLARIRALIALGSIIYLCGQGERALPLPAEGAEMAVAAGDRIAQFHTFVMQGGMALMAGRPERATALLDEALGIAPDEMPAHFVATCQSYQAEIALATGALDRAEALFGEVLAAARAAQVI